MKTRFALFLVVLILAAQLVGLFCVSAARERERANNPTFRLECASYDPRDLLRGHYLPLDFKILRDVPASKLDAAARERLREKHADEINRLGEEREASLMMNLDGFWLVLAPNAETGFWEVERATFDDPKIDFNANPENGRAALRLKWSGALWLRFRRPEDAPAPKTFDDVFDPAFGVTMRSYDFELPNSRFYLSEEKAKRFDAEARGNAARVVSAELFLRDDGAPVLKRLFVDGEEF
ncbi:GDYXXLXY domain-containing protein [Candidatus Spyradosoma sp. SGI.093]|uniref:GDYXXLXY domain-containing protein n=1 Tax=Candidatus Spyradosoma sp. SGI.093 TaxID=3420583 RepID=UPI003D05D7A7